MTPALPPAMTAAVADALAWIAGNADRLPALRADFADLRCCPLTALMTPRRWSNAAIGAVADAHGLTRTAASLIAADADGYDAGIGVRGALLSAAGLAGGGNAPEGTPLTELDGLLGRPRFADAPLPRFADAERTRTRNRAVAAGRKRMADRRRLADLEARGMV